jgi:ribosomal protein S8
MLKKKEEKLKYALFANQINNAINRKLASTIVKNFVGLLSILKELNIRGFIRGFEIIDDQNIKIFFKFNMKTGDSVLETVKLLTKSSLRNYLNLTQIKRLLFHNKSFLMRVFIMSTKEGLVVIDTVSSVKEGGELIFQIN